ncbi:MAG: hypothetical protein C5B58_10970 [Acidobacteria bacterium]|nr:MAG: hypothetical protein C5B58_10970 [Acidobacteriota bacterium]
MIEQEIYGPLLPHMFFGDPGCCGTLRGLKRLDQPETADIACNECNVVVRTVPMVDLRQTLDQMETTLEPATAECPHCGAVNLFPGFKQMLAYRCRKCGDRVFYGLEG